MSIDKFGRMNLGRWYISPDYEDDVRLDVRYNRHESEELPGLGKRLLRWYDVSEESYSFNPKPKSELPSSYPKGDIASLLGLGESL